MTFDTSTASIPSDHSYHRPVHEQYDGNDYSRSSVPGTILLRILQDDDSPRGQTVLTVLYLCVLGVCFVLPFFFYCRIHRDERHNRRLRDLEIEGIAQAMNESQVQEREESRATRRKYREERRARIVQLFSPVRMILKEENFDPRMVAIHEGETGDESLSSLQGTSKEEPLPSSSTRSVLMEPLGVVDGGCDDDAARSIPPSAVASVQGAQVQSHFAAPINCDGLDDEKFILVPEAGLPINSVCDSFHAPQAYNGQKAKLRRTSNECSICLCEYTVGSDVVWSSNPQCEHVFHATCIETWLMKRGGPMCPCCRRDFVIDPFDLGQDEENADVDIEVGMTSVPVPNVISPSGG